MGPVDSLSGNQMIKVKSYGIVRIKWVNTLEECPGSYGYEDECDMLSALWEL